MIGCRGGLRVYLVIFYKVNFGTLEGSNVGLRKQFNRFFFFASPASP